MIGEVIGWKFNHQPGMRTVEDDQGVQRIVEFPGGIPTQAQQDAWTAEHAVFQAGVTAAAAKLGVDLANVKGDNPIVVFLKMSPAEIDVYIDANVTGANAASVASIKGILKVLAKVVAVTARERIS